VHPHLWTVPGINLPIRSYGLTIAVGILLALVISWRRARRVGADPSAVTSMGIIGVIFGILGCRVMHFVHHRGDEVKSGALSVGDVVTATSGGEILGGIVLAVASVIVYLRVRGKPIRAYLDIAFPPMLLAMGIGRVGCFLFGCCWGGVCETPHGEKGLPWAVRFPYGSPAYVRDLERARLTAPDELTWHLPGMADEISIPRTALTRETIDDNPALAEYALLVEKANAARRADPDYQPPADMVAKLKALVAEMGRKPYREEVFAALHLRDLQAAGEPRTWSDLRTRAGTEHSRWVHPAQLYDAISLVLIFVFTSAVFYRRGPAGATIAWGMMLYGINRFVQEMIRGDNPRDTFGLTISQFMSLLILAAGVVMLLYFTDPLRRASDVTEQVSSDSGRNSASTDGVNRFDHVCECGAGFRGDAKFCAQCGGRRA
jgi:phosphatidylglycerol:prolipoprotein diacylglycerol transferase